MSLQFIAGGAGSGKTHSMHMQILERAAQNPDCNFIILVPEQFNMQTQRDIVQKSPHKGIMNIDVLSFSRLAHRIFDEAGVSAGAMLRDTGKSMILRALSSRHGGDLKALGGNLDKAGCIDELKSVISEFMQYDIFPSDVRALTSSKLPGINDTLSMKLDDIAFLYEKMLEYLKERYIVPEELLDRAVRVADRAAFLKNSEIYLDGYTGFTPVQLRFLSHMMRISKRLVVTVTVGKELLNENGRLFDASVMNDNEADVTQLFFMGINTIRQLTRLAVDEPKVALEPPLTLTSQYRFPGVPGLVHIWEDLFRTPGSVSGTCSGGEEDKEPALSIHEASDLRLESEHVCRSIYRLVREKGAKFSDIAVLTGDCEEYERFLLTELVKYEIPFFMDSRRSVSLNPLSEYIDAIVDMTVSSYSVQSVSRFLKTGFTGFTPDEIRLFENYISSMGIRGKKDYLTQWDRAGHDTDEQRLLFLNSLRERFADLTKELMEQLPPRKKVASSRLVHILYDFLEKTDVYGQLMQMSAYFEQQGDIMRADEYRQMYETLMDLMDQCVEFLQDEPVSIGELGDILRSGLEEASVGILPPDSESVIIGDIRRCRINEVKYLFLMGVNDSLIPRDEKKSGLLSEMDRRILKNGGLLLSASTAEEAFIQRFYLYMYLTKAGEGLYLSYSLSASDGSRRLPSYLIHMLLSMFADLEVQRVPERIDINELYTKQEGLYYLAGALKEPLTDPLKDRFNELFDYYASRQEYKDVLKRMTDHAFRIYAGEPISAAAAKALYGEVLVSSISRLEQFASCPYSHFLSYGLRLREKKDFSFDARDLGSVYHDVIKRYFDMVAGKGYKSWKDISGDEAALMIDRALNDAFSHLTDSPIYATKRSAYAEKRIRRMMEKNLPVITWQIQSGDFIPTGTEYRFQNELLRGTVDRFDVYRQGNNVYLRVVDYKSGANSVNPCNILDGTELQLPLYLREVTRLLEKAYPGCNIYPAGMYYYHIHDPLTDLSMGELPDETALELAVKDDLILEGISDSDKEIICHMDRDIERRSHVIRVSVKNDGTLGAGSKVVPSGILKDMADYAGYAADAFSEEIKQGVIKARPYREGDITACRYCRYGDICGFDERIVGCGYKDATTVSPDEACDIISKIVRKKEQREDGD